MKGGGDMICSKCGKEFHLKPDTKRWRIKHGVPLDLCYFCNMSIKMSKEWPGYKEDNICVKCNKPFKLSKGLFKIRNRRKLPLNICQSCTISNAQKIRHENYSDEEKAANYQMLLKGLKKYFADPEKRKHHSDMTKTHFASLDKHTMNKIIKKLKNGRKRWYETITDDQLKEVAKKASEGRKRYWRELSPEEYQRICQERRDRYQKLSEEDKIKKVLPMLMGRQNFGPTEIDFDKILKSFGFIEGINYSWGYNTYPYIHPKFYEILGKVNPITKSVLYPYKDWDFIIYSKLGNDIILDIDGSIHITDYKRMRNDGSYFSNLDLMKYNDSIRKYHIPPKMDAYIMLCYNDKIDESTEIISLQTEKRIHWNEFINIILSTSIPKKLFSECIKDL